MALNMDDIMRSRLNDHQTSFARRQQGLAAPESAATDAADRAAMTVLAPGQQDDPAKFTYEPFSGAPGAWIVYPPGVSCDPSVARVSRDGPANADDFPEMQQMLDDQGPPADGAAGSPLPPPPTNGAVR